MTPFFTLLAYLKLNDPFFTFLKSWMTPLFIISFHPIAPLFDLQMIFSNYLGTFPFAN